jgi:hypothetical protein
MKRPSFTIKSFRGCTGGRNQRMMEREEWVHAFILARSECLFGGHGPMGAMLLAVACVFFVCDRNGNYCRSIYILYIHKIYTYLFVSDERFYRNPKLFPYIGTSFCLNNETNHASVYIKQINTSIFLEQGNWVILCRRMKSALVLVFASSKTLRFLIRQCTKCCWNTEIVLNLKL